MSGDGRMSMGVNCYLMDYADRLVLTGELNDVGAALRTNVARSYRAGAELMGALRIGQAPHLAGECRVQPESRARVH